MVGELSLQDAELAAYWVPHWKHSDLGTWPQAVKITVYQLRQQIKDLERVVGSSDSLAAGYRDVIDLLGLTLPEQRGSGTLTVLAALSLGALAQQHGSTISEALLCAASAVGTDTDTIATMAGAIMGCAQSDMPEGPILDADYIATEAARVASEGAPVPGTIGYPDLLKWEPPKTQADALKEDEDGLLVVGLGRAEALSEPIASKASEFAWQWIRIEEVQTALVKRRHDLPRAAAGDVPVKPVRRAAQQTSESGEGGRKPEPSRERPQEEAPAVAQQPADRGAAARSGRPRSDRSVGALEGALDRTRASGYDVRVIGISLARLAREEGEVVAAMYGSIVARDLAGMRSRR